MTVYGVKNDYFEWLCDLACGERYPASISYRNLLMYLHDTEFVYLIPKDENRADDGIAMRYRFACGYRSPASAETYLDGPCSVLEMLVALAIRCEETIMDDPSYGDRTRQWFWGMLNNLDIAAMTNDRFDDCHVRDVLDRFLNRDYSPNGKGGLFTIKNYDQDLRDVDIWIQLCWYLDSIT